MTRYKVTINRMIVEGAVSPASHEAIASGARTELARLLKAEAQAGTLTRSASIASLNLRLDVSAKSSGADLGALIAHQILRELRRK